jgi:hypothetical protein
MCILYNKQPLWRNLSLKHTNMTDMHVIPIADSWSFWPCNPALPAICPSQLWPTLERRNQQALHNTHTHTHIPTHPPTHHGLFWPWYLPTTPLLWCWTTPGTLDPVSFRLILSVVQMHKLAPFYTSFKSLLNVTLSYFQVCLILSYYLYYPEYWRVLFPSPST